MKKNLKGAILLAIVILFAGQALAQRNGISVNYLYMNEVKSSGIGLQGNFKLGKFITLLPDAGYFFKQNENITSTNYYHKYQTSYLVVNANVGSDISLGKRLVLCPLAGAGFLQEFRKGVMHSDGSGSSYNPGGGYNPAPYNIPYEHNPSTIVVNLGANLKYFFSNRLFATIGYKAMLDIYDGTYNEPLYLNAGIGVRW